MQITLQEISSFRWQPPVFKLPVSQPCMIHSGDGYRWNLAKSLVLFCSCYQTNQHPDHIETASGVSHFKSANHSKTCPLEFGPTAFEALNTASRSFPQGPRQKMSQGASRTSNFTGALIRVPPCSCTRVIPWQKSRSRIKSLPICLICFKS